MSAHLQRASVLFHQHKFDLAEEELRRDLALDPQSAHSHAMLALCLSARRQYQEATREAQQAIGLAPDYAYSHFVHARVLIDRNRLTEAEQAILEAINLDPANADFFATLSDVYLQRREWAKALSAAEEGLYFDPEHPDCNNLRAVALVKLNRRDEAGWTIDATLARDPENAVTHANQGWALLEQRQTEKAMEHFREALRLNPDLDWARAGIVEALKSRNFIYRIFLMYFFWMSKMSAAMQWGVILGGYFLIRFLSRFMNDRPETTPFILPIIILYIVFVLLTWIAQPLFNLLLRLNRFGRHALSRQQIVASNWVGACLLLVLLSLLGWLGMLILQFITGPHPLLEAFGLLCLITAGMFGLLVIPLSAVFNCTPGWPRQIMAVYTAGLALVGVFGLLLLFTGSEAVYTIVTVFLLGAFLSAFLANALVFARVKR